MNSTNFIVLELEGNLDSFRASQVETPFYARLGAAQSNKDIVLVDLSAVSFLSSLGIRILFTSVKKLKKRSIPFAIIQPQAEVALSALELSGLKSSAPMYTSLEEAKQNFPVLS